MIPLKAELDMRRDTVLTSSDRVSRLLKSVTMTVEFDDCTCRMVPLAIFDGITVQPIHTFRHASGIPWHADKPTQCLPMGLAANHAFPIANP